MVATSRPASAEVFAFLVELLDVGAENREGERAEG
jgi:hypothetical protein